MSFSPRLEQLIQAFRCLPGVGPKSAQRMAFYLLERERERGRLLARSIEHAMDHIGHCQQCRTFCEHPICNICNHPGRDSNLLCIVETPADIYAIEQTASYRGRYFVLMGHLSPLDGIGPEHLGLDQLKTLLTTQNVKEIILATNSTVEGEATAHYISDLVKPLNIRVTRLAHGIPLGGELEFVDSNTLARALDDRTSF